MSNVLNSIDADIRQWIAAQKMFFVATAPLSGDGRVNLSPKGHDTLRVVDERTLVFMDYGGSGVETVAHLRENGRIVIMMCAFEGPPKIYRFHGRGRVITPRDPDFDVLADLFAGRELGIRTIIRVEVDRVSQSCGFGVPLYEFREQRDTSPEYTRRQGARKISRYLGMMNEASIDGLPGLSGEETDAFRGPGE